MLWEFYTKPGWSPTIVETGCMSQDDMRGAGNSTEIFCRYIHETEHGRLLSIDKNNSHINFSKDHLFNRFPTTYKSKVTFIQGDSIEEIDKLPGRIDLLYLDSFDYPYGDVINKLGLDINDPNLLQILSNKSEESMFDSIEDLIFLCQRHCKDEIVAALPKLSASAIVMLDDGSLPGGGKSRLAKEVLRKKRFTCLLDSYQSVWTKF